MAAGLGTRMKSNRAKVLHELGGLPLIAHVSRAAQALEPRSIIAIVGHQAEQVEQAVLAEVGELASFVIQAKQRGTGDAVESARQLLENSDSLVLVLSGDVPMIKVETLKNLIEHHQDSGAACTILSVRLENPTGYGRIIRDDNDSFQKIVEQRDASEEERQVKEINSGIYCFEARDLFRALRKVEPKNDQGEYYLTDVPEIIMASGGEVSVYVHNDAREVYGVNSRAELAEFENLVRRNAIRRLMIEGGVTFIDPSHSYVSAEAQIGRDTIIHPNVTIEGKSIIGENCVIRAGVRITNSRLADNVVVKDHSVIIDSEVGANCSVGPFAHLRMNALLEEKAAVGNFVEVKKSRLKRGTKAMHLTYLGDATIGERTNIGAGTVTCNFDGTRKHETIIEDDVKVGSDTMLVAPVRVGARSVTGAGSVITRDVPPDSLVAGVPAEVKKKLKHG
ncbi:MAG TPA: bifunctional UDP-N-acetylglucosamine diphosphorylase/glucosamine-1-phosphate N-acetyltransferase GlmU [Pyrinomonadaceae bacterium]|jgi:bifunctional UDP-N-acetylglucosamine pyrophosphorylase / glucosamine-1-phosphate N-acetyltransferase|nr:bifunctional UDP-N-acetylglucosamine diphosphorylase/glucosamine-1-phosphate N-acetyltransferase GlmU [Pyrinomonadaceae bacterium]